MIRTRFARTPTRAPGSLGDTTDYVSSRAHRGSCGGHERNAKPPRRTGTGVRLEPASQGRTAAELGRCRPGYVQHHQLRSEYLHRPGARCRAVWRLRSGVRDLFVRPERLPGPGDRPAAGQVQQRRCPDLAPRGREMHRHRSGHGPGDGRGHRGRGGVPARPAGHGVLRARDHDAGTAATGQLAVLVLRTRQGRSRAHQRHDLGGRPDTRAMAAASFWPSGRVLGCVRLGCLRGCGRARRTASGTGHAPVVLRLVVDPPAPGPRPALPAGGDRE